MKTKVTRVRIELLERLAGYSSDMNTAIEMLLGGKKNNVTDCNTNVIDCSKTIPDPKSMNMLKEIRNAIKDLSNELTNLRDTVDGMR